ncbi:AMP-binding protein [Conexibacter sp. JD483]|uniref:AMP-dependent synthetase/ligase n=1 Tax=unclassified Conexibacter TaxID=2627773 RepID=UPI0027203BD4|nr:MULTISPECIES: AMP-binding protein [unclassified Conexibacter]MDO8189090.1 AMP-binding protein [Conexibacter sp. CPCC 205706]MDO8201863.1 AMP-binding protein [Conexibacter sp. CPCC 205762]MDR9372782.1 AMP-binding protein [Conexibacter sp. JD483]
MSTVSASPQTLTDAVAAIVAARGEQLAVQDREGTVRFTWRELRDAAARIAGGLAALGAGRDATVGLLLDNRPEFHVADLAAVLLGAVPVSIYQTSSPEQVAHVAADADLRVLIVQASYLETARAALHSRETRLVVLDDAELRAGEVAFAELESSPPLEQPVEVGPEDLLTIIYTSGTTGPPKGVELTHRNLLTATRTVGEWNGIEAGGRVICWLPLAHIAERIASWYAPVLFGLEVTTCPDARQIGRYLREVRPNWFFAVPRVWEKLRAGAMAAGAGLEPAQLRAALGLDQVRAANIGAAPSAPELVEYFHAIGIPLAEIYGMSENCACCTCNPPGAVKVGSVGPALPGVELRLADDGELLMRGPTVMRGYRGLPEATAATIDADGWLRTGDVATIDDDGYLRIVDRKKELIISAGGKNMSPSAIEAAIKTRSPLIGHICVVGDGRPYNVALIVPDPDLLGERAPGDEGVRAAIATAVQEGNASLSRAEQVKRFELLTDGWQAGGEELTPTMKLKRRAIEAKHAPAIEALYAEVRS